MFSLSAKVFFFFFPFFFFLIAIFPAEKKTVLAHSGCSNNTIDRTAYNQQQSISHSSGDWTVQGQGAGRFSILGGLTSCCADGRRLCPSRGGGGSLPRERTDPIAGRAALIPQSLSKAPPPTVTFLNKDLLIKFLFSLPPPLSLFHSVFLGSSSVR